MTGKEALEFMHKLRMDNFDKVGDCLQQLHRELERKQELEEENEKLKEIIKDNFEISRLGRLDGVIFRYGAPSMVKEIKEVLKDD